MNYPIQFFDEDPLYTKNRGTLTMIHIADIHFGCAIEPKVEYNILKEQMVDELEPLQFDILSIDGDLFDRKFMSNTEPILYASLLISDYVNLCKRKNATLVILAGTKEHDAGQLKLFYHYLGDPEIDIRIVESIQFEYIKGAKVLCIPELYGIDEEVYQFYLKKCGTYDMCFMHGTIHGSVYNDNVGQSRLFNIEDFSYCKGPIISGHVHTGGCFNSYFYYTGTPIRYQFGQENPKGFLIVLYNLDSREHYVYLKEIHSFRYDTVNLDDLITSDPKDIINYVDRLHENGIDNIRIQFTKEIPSDNLNILKNYYRSRSHIKFDVSKKKMRLDKNDISSNMEDTYEKYKYLFDPSLTPYDRLAKFISEKETDIIVTGQQIKDIVDGIDI